MNMKKRLIRIAVFASSLTLTVAFIGCESKPVPPEAPEAARPALTKGELRPPILHLEMDDNAATPVVLDASAGAQDQTFLDPSGDPNTDAHSVAGAVGTALSFDGVDDMIFPAGAVDAALTAGHDFAFAFWWACGPGNNGAFIFRKKTAIEGVELIARCWSAPGAGEPYTKFDVFRSITPGDSILLPVSEDGSGWNHYVLQRRGDAFELWANGALVQEDTTVGNDRDFSGGNFFALGSTGGGDFAQGAMDDFRVYDRALLASEIEGLAVSP